MTLQTIPLDRLALAEGNVRRTAAETGLDELAASIAAHGLLQNLSVRALVDASGAPTGRYEVVAGGRRYRALKRLAQAKRIKKSHPTPCAVIDGFSTTEIGLAENLHCPMHPADQYEAFARLAAEGQSPADIAARFGVSEPTVRQRLKLGKVSPALLDRYREGEMNLDCLMAFTVSDDQEAQEQAWAELPEWNRSPELVRRALTKQHTAASEPLARFIGLDPYEAAGGRVLRDLFDQNRTWLLDGDLLGRLAAEKLEGVAEEVRAEGWKWVEVGFGYPQGSYGWRRVYPTTRAPTPEEADEHERLETRLEKIAVILDGGADEALAEEAKAIEQRLAVIDGAQETFTAEQKAIAGAVVWLDPQGTAAIERGPVRPEDEPAPEPAPAGSTDTTPGSVAEQPDAAKAASVGGDAAAPEEEGLRPLSERLIEDLTAHRTAGLRLALAQQPETALVAVVHALAVRLFHGRNWDSGSCLDIQPCEPQLTPCSDTIQGSPAIVAFEALRRRWRARLPGEAEELWDWLLAADPATRLDLLAFCAGAITDVTKRRSGPPGRGALAHADQLAAAVTLDLRSCWSPTQAAYLDKVSKRHILAAVAEVAGEKAQAWAGLKKAALVELAEPVLTAARWLPEPLRLPRVATGAPATSDALPTGDSTERVGEMDIDASSAEQAA